MRKFKNILTLAAVLSCLLCFSQQPFVPGNIVVYRVGDGTTTLNDDFFKVYLDEYTTSGTLVQTIELPSTTTVKLTNLGRLPESGLLTRSPNGKYLVIPGFNEPLGVLNDAKRSVAVVDFNGGISSITAFENLNFDEIHAVATDNGSRFWVSGTNGIEYLQVGSSTPTKIASYGGYSTGIDIVNGQLYVSNSNFVPQIAKVGSGLPTTTGQTLTGLPGLMATSDNYCVQFAFADLDVSVPGNDVLYLTSQVSSGNGGIKKYSLVNGTWTLNGTIGTTADRYAGLTVKVIGSSVEIFATRQGANEFLVRGGDLVKLVDNSGYNGTLTATPTVILSAPTANTKSFRGVALVPEPAPYTAGNIVLYRVGEGIAELNDDFFKVYLDEYTTSGNLVQTIALPSAGTKKINNVGRLPESGLLTLSSDGKFLVVPGFNEPLGVLNDAKRSIGLIDYNSTVSSVTAIDNPNFDIIHSAATNDGTKLWFTGTNGVEFTPTGSTAITKIASYGGYSTGIRITDGQLYVSHSNYVPQIAKLGNGLPTTTGQALTTLPGINSSADNFCVQFEFADLEPSIPGNDVLYITSQASSGIGGVKKYSLVNGTWILNGTIGTTSDRYSAMTIKVSASTVTIFATRLGSNTMFVGGGQVVRIVDNSGYNGVFNGTPSVILSVSTPNTKSYRGVALVPLGCSSVSGLQVSSITPTSATASWNGSAGTTYEWAITSTITPPLTGTQIVTNMVTVSGLQNSQTYYVHLRVVCGSQQTSEWTTQSFVTGCKPPPVPALHIISSPTGSLTVNWRPVAGASTFEYSVTTTATPPGAGTTVHDTTIVISNLSAISKYYLHVRSNCGSGVFSPWATKEFTTVCFMPQLNVVVLPDKAGISWNKIDNAVRYEYAITYTTAKPLSGNLTVDTFLINHKLTDGSGYYIHVRSFCSNGAVSEWSTAKFNTPGIEVYPSPVKTMLTINLYNLNSATGTITIGDVIGRVVFRIKPTSNIVSVDASKWASGIYLVRYDDGKNQYTTRIMKQ